MKNEVRKVTIFLFFFVKNEKKKEKGGYVAKSKKKKKKKKIEGMTFDAQKLLYNIFFCVPSFKKKKLKKLHFSLKNASLFSKHTFGETIFLSFASALPRASPTG
jgi:hypothetical protein